MNQGTTVTVVEGGQLIPVEQRTGNVTKDRNTLVQAYWTVPGNWQARQVKTYSCRSCGVIVCRRCLVRLEGRPYCRDCGQTLSADCSAQYSRCSFSHQL